MAVGVVYPVHRTVELAQRELTHFNRAFGVTIVQQAFDVVGRIVHVCRPSVRLPVRDVAIALHRALEGAAGHRYAATRTKAAGRVLQKSLMQPLIVFRPFEQETGYRLGSFGAEHFPNIAECRLFTPAGWPDVGHVFDYVVVRIAGKNAVTET